MSTPTVIPFVAKAEPSLVDMADSVFAKAAAGEFRAMAFIGITKDGSIATRYSFGDDSRPYAALIAGAELLKKRVIEENK